MKNLLNANRILILGGPGTGKSTLARLIAQKTNLPLIHLIHLDQHFWNPGWQFTPLDQWDSKVELLASRAQWIMDGNYARSLHVRIPRADVIINLELGRLHCMWRCFTRTLRSYDTVRSDMPTGCTERFDFKFYKYIWDFSKIHGERNKFALEYFCEGKHVIRLRNTKDMKLFIETLHNTMMIAPPTLPDEAQDHSQPA